jgi:hypothetical protein
VGRCGVSTITPSTEARRQGERDVAPIRCDGHAIPERPEQGRQLDAHRLVADLDASRHLPQLGRRTTSQTSRHVITVLHAQCHVRAPPKDRRQRRQGKRPLAAAGRASNGQARLELHDHGVGSPGEERDLPDRDQAWPGQVTVRGRQVIQRHDLGVVSLPAKPEYLGQQRRTVTAGWGRHRSDDKDLHPKLSKDASIASSTPGQL